MILDSAHVPVPRKATLPKAGDAMETFTKNDTQYRLAGTRRIARTRKKPLNLVDFFGEFPANPELCELILRAIANLKIKPDSAPTENEAFALGVLAYIYSFSSVEVGRTLYEYAHPQETSGRRGSKGWNHLWVVHGPGAGDPSPVQCTNDVLYCVAALDLGREPVLLYTPEISDRFFSYQFIDAHANSFAQIGGYGTCGRESIHAIVGPGWRGKLSPGFGWIQSMTHQNLLIGRIAIRNELDIAAVEEIYSQSTLAPLSCFKREKGNDPKIQRARANGETLDLSGLKWFEFGCNVLNENPPPAWENDLIALFARLGYGPGFDFRTKTLSASIRSGLKRAIPVAKNEIVRYAKTMGAEIDGWHSSRLNSRVREMNYIEQAAIAFEKLTATSAEEVFYAECRSDLHGRPLNGSKRYILRFEKGRVPPVKAFWSLASYGSPAHIFVDKRLEFSPDGAMRQFKYGDDGSLEIHIQNAKPRRETDNWLRAPKGRFSLTLRGYVPCDELVSGAYQLPPIKSVDGR